MLFIKSLGRLALTRTTATAAAAPLNISTKHLLASSSSSVSGSASASLPASHNFKQEELISIKDSCLNRLKQILAKPEEEYLRIQVETGGCNGFSYLFDIETNAKLNPAEDLIFEREKLRVVVNKDILPYMKGASVEFTESLIKSSFQVTNPVAETKCSCGSSFSIDPSKLTANQSQNKQQ